MALGKAGQPAFTAKDFQPELSQQYLDELCDFGSYSCIDAPDYWMFQKAIRKGPNSFPGPDGIPYWAWKRSGYYSIATLRIVDEVLRNGGEPAHYFNNSIIQACAFLLRVRMSMILLLF